MSRTDYIYSDKLSLELFREDKRPSTNVGSTSQGLLFINTKPTGSTKLAIRPKTGQFIVGEQDNQNPTASVHAKTNYLLFCNSIHVDEPAQTCTGMPSITERTLIEGQYLLEKFGKLDTNEYNANGLLRQIENDPNLVVLYDHPDMDGYHTQVLISPKIIVGATDSFYIELDGVHINTKGESIIEAMLNYADPMRLMAEPTYTGSLADLMANSYLPIENRDHSPHSLYIRYIGNDPEILATSSIHDPLLFTSVNNGYQLDPDGLGIKISFAAQNNAHLSIFPWFQYSTGPSIVGNRYVIEVNGVKYRDTRSINDLTSPIASLQGVVELNPQLSKILNIASGGEFNKITNISDRYLDVKIYLDENAPYYQNNKTVDTGDNPSGIYKKLDYPYGSEPVINGMRNAITRYPSVYIKVSDAGYSFRLGPNKVVNNDN